LLSQAKIVDGEPVNPNEAPAEAKGK
jgi:hypothetical protein